MDACGEYGLQVGIYYSPWDRNHPDYDKPEYIPYLPIQARYPSGFIAEYALEVSQEGKNWIQIARGECANFHNSPIRVDVVKAGFVKLKALRTTDGNPATYGKFGIITRWLQPIKFR